jgi:hypothetical protein
MRAPLCLAEPDLSAGEDATLLSGSNYTLFKLT